MGEALVWGEERMSSICGCRTGGKGSDRSCGRAFGVFSKEVMRLGSRVSGCGCRVNADVAVEKSVVWREAWKREVRSVVL